MRAPLTRPARRTGGHSVHTGLHIPSRAPGHPCITRIFTVLACLKIPDCTTFLNKPTRQRATLFGLPKVEALVHSQNPLRDGSTRVAAPAPKLQAFPRPGKRADRTENIPGQGPETSGRPCGLLLVSDWLGRGTQCGSCN